MWNNALEEIQQNIGNKLDKLEFDPLRDFVNSKISKLQERLKALIALKKEQEAAGSKSRFLRLNYYTVPTITQMFHKFLGM